MSICWWRIGLKQKLSYISFCSDTFFPQRMLGCFWRWSQFPNRSWSCMNASTLQGVGITQWSEHWTHDWKVTGSNPCRTSRRIFFSRVNFLCWLLFRYPFHPRVSTVTAVAHQISWSFCQKCRWQVTAKHASTLCMWLCMKWHGAWLYGVHRTCAETAAVSRDSSHASVESTPLWWISKNTLQKASHSCKITWERSLSARERRIALYKSDQQQLSTQPSCLPSLFSARLSDTLLSSSTFTLYFQSAFP